MADKKDTNEGAQEGGQEGGQEPFEITQEDTGSLANLEEGELAGQGTIQTEYAALAMGPEERRDLAVGIKEAAGSDGINIWDLPRVTLPAGGMTVWEINSGGAVEHVDAIDGIIVHATSPRAFWKLGLEESGGSTPPDCSSEDGKTGIGDPGGDCYECEYNQWGSADTGEGKACKEKRMLFVLRKGSYLPMIVQAPSTSIPAVKSHFMRAVSEHGVSYKLVETQLTLEKVTGSSFPYSRIVPAIKGRVTDEEKPVLQEYIDAISPAFHAPQARTVQQDE